MCWLLLEENPLNETPLWKSYNLGTSVDLEFEVCCLCVCIGGSGKMFGLEIKIFVVVCDSLALYVTIWRCM